MALVLFAPLIGIVALAVHLQDHGPAIYKQERVTKGGRIFTLYKFRSMVVDAEKKTGAVLMVSDDDRLTKVGKFIRKTRLDELPQLWNIFKGDMSIIGPRPALFNQYDLIEERDKYLANDIKPGLTGWAQINGRDELPINVKARYDGEYVKNISFIFDMKCIIGTIKVVFTHDGLKEGGTGGI